MRFEILQRIMERLHLALLLVCVFGLSKTRECNDFHLRSINNNGRFLECICSADSTHCFMCFRRRKMPERNIELLLPCSDQGKGFKNTQVHILYLFRNGSSGSISRANNPLVIAEEETLQCADSYESATALNKVSVLEVQNQPNGFQSGLISILNINPKISYRIKVNYEMNNFPPGSIICFTNVSFVESDVAATTTTPSISEVTKRNQERSQGKFPTWVIFLIIAILIIGSFAVAGVLIYRRKKHDHYRDSTDRAMGSSNSTNEYTTNDHGGVVSNSAYYQDLDEKEEEYHSYVELDVSGEMIYNSTYESAPANMDTLNK